MVQIGDFVVQLVDPKNPNIPFPESQPDYQDVIVPTTTTTTNSNKNSGSGATKSAVVKVEGKPGSEYYISIQKWKAQGTRSKTSVAENRRRRLIVRPFVDGQSLRNRLYYRRYARDSRPRMVGIRTYDDGTKTLKQTALQFRCCSSLAASSSTSSGGGDGRARGSQKRRTPKTPFGTVRLDFHKAVYGGEQEYDAVETAALASSTGCTSARAQQPTSENPTSEDGEKGGGGGGGGGVASRQAPVPPPPARSSTPRECRNTNILWSERGSTVLCNRINFSQKAQSTAKYNHYELGEYLYSLTFQCMTTATAMPTATMPTPCIDESEEKEPSKKNVAAQQPTEQTYHPSCATAAVQPPTATAGSVAVVAAVAADTVQSIDNTNDVPPKPLSSTTTNANAATTAVEFPSSSSSSSVDNKWTTAPDGKSEMIDLLDDSSDDEDEEVAVIAVQKH